MDYILFFIWLCFMLCFHFIFKKEFTFIQRYFTKLFNSYPFLEEKIKNYLRTTIYSIFTYLTGKTFNHQDFWVELFFVSTWMLVDQKQTINKKPSIIGILIGFLLQYFI